jgi:hypothetical protein
MAYPWMPTTATREKWSHDNAPACFAAQLTIGLKGSINDNNPVLWRKRHKRLKRKVVVIVRERGGNSVPGVS